MLYSYKATRKDGSPLQGTTEGTSREAVMAHLARQGIHPMVVKPVKQSAAKKASGNFSFGKKVKTADLVIFTRQLSVMISAGVPLSRGLSILQESPSSPYFRQVLGAIAKEVEGGAPLGDSFAKYPNIFDDVYVNMVRAGEAGGILDEILKRLAGQVEQNASIKKRIKGAMTYPAVIGVVTVVAFFGIMFFVMPKIAKILTDLGGPNAKLPIYTQVLLDFSHMCQHYGFIVIPIFVAIVYGILRYIKTPGGKYKFHALMLRTPVIKVVITKIAIARFSRTFASLMSAGVGVLQALAITGGAIGNKVIEKELADAAIEVQNGKQLSEVLEGSPHFPKIVSQMLAVGEETGQTDAVLIKVADFYEEEVATTIDSLASIIEPVMIVVLGSGVGLIAASVMGPIASMSNNVGNN